MGAVCLALEKGQGNEAGGRVAGTLGELTGP
jgi:hypothetical protein